MQAPRRTTSESLFDAILAISQDLSLPAVLERIVSRACEITDARYGALGVLAPGSAPPDIRLTEFITYGVDDEALLRVIGHYPEGHGMIGALFQDPRPLRLRDLREHPQSVGFPAGHPAMRSFLGLPIRVRGEVFGNLYLTEKQGGDEFTEEDEARVIELAAAAGVAIDNARLHERVQEMAVLQDRERIARDLHDTVIQRLFAIGLSLQAAGPRVVNPEVASRIQQAVDDLDATIRDIRGLIFALNAHAAGVRSVRVNVLAVCAEAQESLGFMPRVHFDGPVDSSIDDELEADLLAVLREMLTNVVRHASGVTEVDVHLRVGAEVTLRVLDNGESDAKLEPRDGGHGLTNMRRRAEARGGSFSVARRDGRGTEAVWTTPRSGS